MIAGANRERLEDLKAGLENGALHLRVVALLSDGKLVPPDGIRANGVKLFHDGSIQGYTGYLSAPYFKQPEGKSDYRGYAAKSREELAGLVKRHHRAGYQVAIHGNGDAAIDDIFIRVSRSPARSFPGWTRGIESSTVRPHGRTN